MKKMEMTHITQEAIHSVHVKSMGITLPMLLVCAGVGSLRLSSSKQPLPNERELSFNMAEDTNHVHPLITQAVMVFGQFLDHDIDLTPVANTFPDPEGTHKKLSQLSNVAMIFGQNLISNGRSQAPGILGLWAKGNQRCSSKAEQTLQ